MTGITIDLETWDRAAQFRFFRGFERPQYSVTARLDLTHLMRAKAARGLSPYRATLWAVGAGLHAVPALRMRFRGDVVTLHDRTDLSMTVPRADGTFGYGYLPWRADLEVFDAEARTRIAQAAAATGLCENEDRQDVAYVSCLPWIDATAISNPLPHAADCIPRIGWARIVPEADRHAMSMSAEVHHALVDGAHLGAFFNAVQAALDRV